MTRTPNKVYGKRSNGIFGDCEAIVPSDDNYNDARFGITSGIYVGRDGDVAVVMAGNDSNDPVIFKNVKAGTVLPVRAVRVADTGTSPKTDLVALYNNKEFKKIPVFAIDTYWPGVGFAMQGTTTFDNWNGTTNPAIADVKSILNMSAMENGDKPGLILPSVATRGNVKRQFKGTFDASTGVVTNPNSSSTQSNGSTFTYADGDWFVIGPAGTYNFNGTAGAVAKAQGEWWMYTGGVWAKKTTCPHFDLGSDSFVWDVTNEIINSAKTKYDTYKGHMHHYVGWWAYGGSIYWLGHTLWNLQTEAELKAFISYYFHWYFDNLKTHFDERGITIAQFDLINEPFDEDLTTDTTDKRPGWRTTTRTFPAYTLGNSYWLYAAAKMTSLGATDVDRYLSMICYTAQTAKKYFPEAKFSINDFGWETRRYSAGTTVYSYTDVNGNAVNNKAVWQGAQQGEKQISVEYHYWKLLNHNNRVPIVMDAVKDAGAVWTQITAIGQQFHIQTKNAGQLGTLARMLNRLSHLKPTPIEVQLTEMTANGEQSVTQAPGTITVSAGVAGATITSIKACYPTTQTVTGDELLAATVNWTTSDANTAALIAASINLGTATHHYVASVLSGAVVSIQREVASPRGFDLTSAKTGTVTLTAVNSRVNEPTTIPPQFRGIYWVAASGNGSMSRSWHFGQSVAPYADKRFENYNSWVMESHIRMYLRNSLIRFFKFWPYTGGLFGDYHTLFDDLWQKTQLYDMWGRITASVDWKAPSARVIPNRHRIDFTWYKHLIFTYTNVTKNASGLGADVGNTTGAFSMPFAFYTDQGLVANDVVYRLQFNAPANPASGTRLFCCFTDANNKVELYFSNATGQLSMKSTLAGVATVDTVIGNVTASAKNVVAFRITSTGLVASLNAAAIVTGNGNTPAGATIQLCFDHAGLNGYNGTRFEHMDIQSQSEISDLPGHCTVRAVDANTTWGLWDGVLPQPALATEST